MLLRPRGDTQTRPPEGERFVDARAAYRSPVHRLRICSFQGPPRRRGGGFPPRSLKTQQHATHAEALRRAPRRKLRGPGPVDVLAARSVIETLTNAGLERRTEASLRCRAVRALSKGLPRKEVIQPQLPLRLPCYDFTPVTGPTFDGSLQKVRPPASGVTHSRGVTGGVYKARERIHRGNADPRLLATPPSSRRVSAYYPNRDAL